MGEFGVILEVTNIELAQTNANSNSKGDSTSTSTSTGTTRSLHTNTSLLEEDLRIGKDQDILGTTSISPDSTPSSPLLLQQQRKSAMTTAMTMMASKSYGDLPEFSWEEDDYCYCGGGDGDGDIENEDAPKRSFLPPSTPTTTTTTKSRHQQDSSLHLRRQLASKVLRRDPLLHHQDPSYHEQGRGDNYAYQSQHPGNPQTPISSSSSSSSPLPRENKRSPPTRNQAQGHYYRYAIKHIRKDLYPKRKIIAVRDLAREAKLLSHLDHPNIVRLRGIVGKPGEETFMILLDRLDITLGAQISEWKEKLQEGSNRMVLFPWKLSTQQQSLETAILYDRLIALYDVAQAMNYLHSKRYVQSGTYSVLSFDCLVDFSTVVISLCLVCICACIAGLSFGI